MALHQSREGCGDTITEESGALTTDAHGALALLALLATLMRDELNGQDVGKGIGA
jgi:hypothetical protein